jgi:hypothetical protein
MHEGIEEFLEIESFGLILGQRGRREFRAKLNFVMVCV